MYDLYTGAPDDETAKVAYLIQLFSYARQNRVNFEVQWEEAAALCWPEYRNSFSFGHVRSPGVKYTQFQVDSKGSIASHRFMCIADALLTPYNMLWSKVCAPDPELMKEREARLYYDEITKIVWMERYQALANFQPQNQKNWHQLGVFGNMGMLVNDLDRRPGSAPPGLSYISTSVGEMYKLVNNQGRCDGYIRHFRWNARRAYQKWGENIPPVLGAALEKADSYTLFDFLEFCIPRTDYDPKKLFSKQGKPWASIYVSVLGYSILEEGGYYTFPWPNGGYMTAPEEEYDRGPAQMVLPELKTLNSEKEAFLKQGLLAGDPAYLMPDDGMFDFKAASGAFNYGAMTADGKKLVDVLPAGNIQVTKEMMDESGKAVDDAFLVSLFPMLFDNKGQQKSAREVIEVANQMGIFLAPTLGRNFSDYLATLKMREMDLLGRMGKFPKPPDVVREAGPVRWQAKFCGPLAMAMSGQSIAGYMRTVEMAKEVVNVTQDNSLMDVFDFDTAMPEIAQDQHVPERWMADPKQVAAKRKQRAASQAKKDYIASLPGLAAKAKAEAITAKAAAGQNIGGTLSGTPQGGMPAVPGAPPGQPGQPGAGPGQPGQPGQPAPGGV